MHSSRHACEEEQQQDCSQSTNHQGVQVAQPQHVVTSITGPVFAICAVAARKELAYVECYQAVT
eukprot:5338488-Amphidinium_carterae.1